MGNKIRVRYAPSPTGNLHIGNARTALFNYLFARHYNGDFIIRTEDTDQSRNIEHGEISQLDNLKWLGLDWDEGPDCGGDYGPYRQSERKDIYQKIIDQLMDENKAYESYMTDDELANQREEQRQRGEMPHYVDEYLGLTETEKGNKIKQAKEQGIKPVIRFKVPNNTDYAWKDVVKGDISFNSDTIGGDFVIQKRDGMPTYNFAVVVDDHLMEISHVFRGDDHVANTPKQLMIYGSLNWNAPQFGHMSLIINGETNKKLSKRDETVLQFIEQYRDLGYLPEAMLNFIILLGWSPVGESELFSLKEFVKMYDEKRLSKSPASFDVKKLEWVNNQYVKNADEDLVMHLCLQQLVSNHKIDDQKNSHKLEWYRKLINLFKRQMSYANQIIEFTEPFLNMPKEWDEEAQKELDQSDSVTVLTSLKEQFTGLEIFDTVNILGSIKQVQKVTGIKGRQLWMPIRIATTYMEHGPELPETLELLGFDVVVKNLNQSIEKLLRM